MAPRISPSFPATAISLFPLFSPLLSCPGGATHQHIHPCGHPPSPLPTRNFHNPTPPHSHYPHLITHNGAVHCHLRRAARARLPLCHRARPPGCRRHRRRAGRARRARRRAARAHARRGGACAHRVRRCGSVLLGWLLVGGWVWGGHGVASPMVPVEGERASLRTGVAGCGVAHGVATPHPALVCGQPPHTCVDRRFTCRTRAPLMPRFVVIRVTDAPRRGEGREGKRCVG